MGYQALLFCPDEKTARTLTQVLSDLDFTVEPCTEPFAAVKKLMAQHFDAVVVDCDNEQNATLLFKSARNSAANQASLAVAVVEGQAGVAKAFRIGANLVLTKPINVEQAKGTLRVARGLLRKSGDAGKGLAAASPAAVAGSVSKPAAPVPRPVAPAAPVASTATRKPITPAPTVKPSVAPVLPSMAASAQVAEIEDPDGDAILEADIDETPIAQSPVESKTAPAPSASSAVGTSKFPWQPSPKMAEPMASALRRAAEAVGQVEEAEPAVAKPTPPPVPEKRPITGAMFQAQASAAAAAPAVEKASPSVNAPAVEEKLAPFKPISVEKASPSKSESTSAVIVDTTRDDPAPPTFFPGGYDTDEVEGGGKTKALVIVAAVVLLASSAGYLSWRNMNSSKSATAATVPTSSTPAPAPSVPAPKTPPAASESTAPAQPAATDITLSGMSDSSSTAASHGSASKPSPKTPATKASFDAEPEVVQRLIVKQDAPHTSKPTTTQDAEQVQAPSAIGMGAGADTKALASIGNAPINVPKAVPQTLKVSQGVMEGLVIKRVQPRYPTQALQMRIQGPVQMQATITKDGDIKNLKVISGDAVLARAAQEAVRQWKYKPYFLNGEPVAIETQILVNFKLPN